MNFEQILSDRGGQGRGERFNRRKMMSGTGLTNHQILINLATYQQICNFEIKSSLEPV